MYVRLSFMCYKVVNESAKLDQKLAVVRDLNDTAVSQFVLEYDLGIGHKLLKN